MSITKLEFQRERSGDMYLNLIKVIVVFTMGSIGMHLLVMLMDYYLIVKPVYLNLHDNFVGTIFSTPMYPMMGVYGLYSLGVYFLWERKKKAILMAREKQLQSEKVEAVLKTMQRITGMLAEHIATHNSEITHWVESRKSQGQLVSERVVLPNKKIAQALHTLSEISFVLPYSENRPENVGDIEKILHEKIGGITEFQKN